MSLTYGQRRSMFKWSQALAKRYDAEAAQFAAERQAAEQARIALANATRTERDQNAPRNIAVLVPGDLVRDSTGWHRVVRVNAKSVTVETPWSWTDRIEHMRIIETRSAE